MALNPFDDQGDNFKAKAAATYGDHRGNVSLDMGVDGVPIDRV
jgi:hypothetical protein